MGNLGAFWDPFSKWVLFLSGYVVMTEQKTNMTSRHAMRPLVLPSCENMPTRIRSSIHTHQKIYIQE